MPNGLIGDADLNGIVTIVDATMIQRYDASMTDFTDEQIAMADVDKDGNATILDVTLLQRYLSGFDVVLG